MKETSNKSDKNFDILLRKNLFRLDTRDDVVEPFKEINHRRNLFFDKKLQRLPFNKKIKLLMKIGHMPSLVACAINKDKVVWSHAYGKSNIHRNRKATLDTVYRLASISKSMTAIAVMQLVDRHKLDLDTDVSEYIGFKLRNPKHPTIKITLKMLLAHQSSLAPSLSPRWFFYFSLLDYPHDYFKEYLLPGGSCYNRDIWTSYEPGKEPGYSSEGIDLAAYAVEQVMGQTFEKYCKDNIFSRLDMNTTGFHLSDFKINELAVPYLYSKSGYLPLPHYDIGTPGSGGALSTLKDLSHYLIMHMNGGIYKGRLILNEDTIEEIHSPQYPESYDDEDRYGLGWYFRVRADGKVYGGHDGILPGFRTVMRMREDKIGVIFFYNRFHYFKVRENFRPIGVIERQAREAIERLLFEKAAEF